MPVSKHRKKKKQKKSGPPPPKSTVAPKKKLTTQQILIYVISALVVISMAVGLIASGLSRRGGSSQPTSVPREQLLGTPAPTDENVEQGEAAPEATVEPTVEE